MFMAEFIYFLVENRRVSAESEMNIAEYTE